MNHWLAFLNKPESLKEQNSDCDQQGEMRHVTYGTLTKSPESKPFRGRRSQTWIDSEVPTSTEKSNVQESISSDIISKLSNRRSRRNRSESWAGSEASSPSGNISTLENATEKNTLKSPNKFLQRGGLPTVGIGSQALSPAGKPSTLGNVSPGKFTTYKVHNTIEVNRFSSTPTKLLTNPHKVAAISNDEHYVVSNESLEENIEVAHLENVFRSSKTPDEEQSEYMKLGEIRLSSSSYGGSISKENSLPKVLDELQSQNEEIKALRQKLEEKDDRIQELEELNSMNDAKLQRIEDLQKELHNERKAASKRLNIVQDRFREEIKKIREEKITDFQNKNASKKEKNEVTSAKTKCKAFSQRNILVSELYRKQKQILNLQQENDKFLKDINESNNSIVKLRSEVEILKSNLQLSQDENKKLHDNGSFYEKRLNDVYSYMQNLSLFEKDLGKFILEEMKCGHSPSMFQNGFAKLYPDFQDIKNLENMEQYKQLKGKIELLEKNDRIRLEKIISVFKLISERLHFMQQQHSHKIKYFQKEALTKEQQFRLEKRRWHDILNLKEENFQKLKSELKEKLILSEKIQKNAEDKLNDYMNEHQEIVEKLQNQALIASRLSTQIQESENTHKKITDELAGKQSEILKLEETILSLKEDVFQEKLNLKKLYGDPSTELNFETVGKSFPHITKEKYDSLGLDILTDLTYVQSQNLIKNLLIVLDIPLKTFLKIVPTIVIQLRCELTLLTKFANDLNLKVFGKQLDFKSRRKVAMNEFLNNHDIAEVKHPLEYDLQALFKYFFS
ncbi:ANL_collapsed_G0006470.mRNA.1.CDS.1 [Saccharomyces cerevisiae]|nr:ANL_HP_G0203050.mRNA.1.CDS.1 [Saccharomyces cerevisiae]CAI5045117.1 ANL_HP_G0087390.mRNA.1.CDS.1 [Saccharomyces cerevisiae]CAI5180938.1 ANL_HP_G0131770.mRNA.1.CDS.1 [Saccharomyces cerevisiae]CAI5205742.1 ANL_HP_G0149570.mRNA.1.CDS.1 [Saccharomyces cerevisiae]CAI6489490.1 ANL_HP_G0203050.mRNA.1.CDS.1 [Saccharomyces cerevisiae]